MIRVEHLETSNWRHAIRGMRNPLKSWEKSDSYEVCGSGLFSINDNSSSTFLLGDNDKELLLRLDNAGRSHRKVLRFITINCDITANLKWFDEFDTYLHIVKNSTSQMHGLGMKGFKFSLESFSQLTTSTLAKNHLQLTVNVLNELHDMYVAEKDEVVKKTIWRDMIELVPQSFLYTRTAQFNYEVFISQYFMRYNHKMVEWRELMELLRYKLPYMDDILKVLEAKKVKED
jgi:hypothetical protein